MTSALCISASEHFFALQQCVRKDLQYLAKKVKTMLREHASWQREGGYFMQPRLSILAEHCASEQTAMFRSALASLAMFLFDKGANPVKQQLKFVIASSFPS